MITCINDLVGLSDNSDTCFETGRPVDYNTSTSGYFITDFEYGFPVFEAIDQALSGGYADVWTLIEKARDSALSGLELDFTARLKTVSNRKLIAFNGNIGNLYSSTSFTKRKTLTGLQIAPQAVKSANLVIDKIYLGLDTTIDPIDIAISSNDPAFATITKTGASQAGVLHVNDYTGDVITLPMYSDNVEYLRYFITVSPPSGTKFLVNKLFCCGRRKDWLNHLKAASFEGDEIPGDTSTQISTQSSSYGIALSAYFACGELDWLCSMDKVAGIEIKQAVARAVQTGAAAKVAQMVLQSPNISRYFTWSREDIAGKYNGLKEVYEETVMFLADNYPVEVNGCYECKQEKQIQKKEILI